MKEDLVILICRVVLPRNLFQINLLKTYSTIFLFTFIFTGSLHSQISSKEDKKVFFEADKAFEFGDYKTAYNNYIRIYPLDSNNQELNFNIGVCAFYIKKYNHLSKQYFKKVSTDEFVETNYFLGRLNHLERNYEKAIWHFITYKKANGNKEYTTEEMDHLIAKSNTAPLYEITADETIQIDNIGENINTIFDEYVPLIPASEDFLIFTSRRPNGIWTKKNLAGEYFEDIYISNMDDEGEWLPPALLDDSIVNTATHDACTGLSADGEYLLIYRTNTDSNTGNIYETVNEYDEWSKPEPLGISVNSEDHVETSACYSSDRNMIFFSSDRPGGFGGKDLYRAMKLPNGKWGEPFNLGKEVNTPYDEDAPYVHPLGDKIYFSSKGHKNMGGYDIFSSEFDEYGNFSIAKNLKYPVNTVGDDIFFVLNSNSTMGYLSSNRTGGEGGHDIYTIKFETNKIPLDVYSLFFLDDQSNEIIKDVTMEAIDLKRRMIYGKYKASSRSGKMVFISESTKEYKIIINAEGYEPFVTTTVFLNHSSKKVFTLTKRSM